MKSLILCLVLVGLVGNAKSVENGESSEHALIAYMRVQVGAEQDFLRSANAVIAESRKETGNLIYHLHQSTTEPQQFVFYELFKTQADLKYHRESDHVKAFLKEVDPIVVPGKFTLEEYRHYVR